MKRLFLVLASIWLVGCETTRTTINAEAAQSVKSIAIMPVELAPGISPEVANEMESFFTTQLMDAGFKVVERHRMAAILKEQALAQSGLTADDTIKIGQLSHADALLFGKVHLHESGVKAVNETDTNGAAVTMNRKFYNFKASMRIVSTQSGDLVVAQENNNPFWQEDPRFVVLNNIGEWRGMVLSGMANDLKKALKKALPKK